MKLTILPLLAAAALAVPAAAAPPRPCSRSRAPGSTFRASGEVTRVPDVAVISTGVVTRATTATAAIQQNAARMERVRAALRRAGIDDKDIQTSSINLNPDYVYVEHQPPKLTGYQASNNVSVRFRDIRKTGEILDALVAEGANQINGPSLTIDKPEAALDEARAESHRQRPGPRRALRPGAGHAGHAVAVGQRIAAAMRRRRQCRCMRARKWPRTPRPRSTRASRRSRSAPWLRLIVIELQVT